jgi:hypothetical protein
MRRSRAPYGCNRKSGGQFSTIRQRTLGMKRPAMGFVLLDRHKLMADLRTNPVTFRAVYTTEDSRCSSFADGVRAAKRWFE